MANVFIINMERVNIGNGDYINPHPRMRGPCGPQKTSPGAYVVIIGIPEPRIYLIVHNTEPLYKLLGPS